MQYFTCTFFANIASYFSHCEMLRPMSNSIVVRVSPL
jgi:hypothetical protein